MKYEYTVVTGDMMSIKNDVKTLEKMSSDRWELISVVAINEYPRMYFRRQVL
jgi:hypothetical protein